MFSRRRGSRSPQSLLLISGRVDDPETGYSELATGVRSVLAEAGIDAQLKPYVLPDRTVVIASWIRDGSIAGPQVSDRIRIGVTVGREEWQRSVEALRAALDRGDPRFEDLKRTDLQRQLSRL